MFCKICNNNNVIKAGRSRSKQRYKCKDCSIHFVAHQKRLNENDRLRTARLCSYEVSMNAVAKMFNVSVTSVARWLKWHQAHPNNEKLLTDSHDRNFARVWKFAASRKTLRQCCLMNFKITRMKGRMKKLEMQQKLSKC